MKAKTYIVERQIAWARRKNINLMASPENPDSVHEWDGKKDRTAYTTTLEANLFEPLNDDAWAEFKAGDGGELGGNIRVPPGGPRPPSAGEGGEAGGSMQALYSSSALACNLFHHLRRPENHSCLLEAIEVPKNAVQSIRFEQKRKVMEEPEKNGFPRDPNLDLVIRLESHKQIETAIECKFREPCVREASGNQTQICRNLRIVG